MAIRPARLIIALTCVWLVTSTAHALDDLQTWNTATATYLRDDELTLAVGAELRFLDDSSSIWFARLSQQARYRPGERWAFDANLSYIRFRSAGEFDLDTLRFELAATPSWSLGSKAGFDLRNRVEWIWREGPADEDWILRLRPRLTFRVGESGRRTLYVGNETLFSDSRGQIFQNRFFPLGAVLPVGRRVRVELYAMLFSVRVADDWRHDIVLGQTWSF